MAIKNANDRTGVNNKLTQPGSSSFTGSPDFYYKFFFILLVFIAIGTRFYNLDTKAFHHDESLYAYYSYQFSLGKGHQYDPLMHGPFVFIMDGSLMWLIGSSDIITRSPSAFFGVLLVILCYFLCPFIGKKGVIILTLYFTFSPSIMYFSRFLRMDIYVLAFTFGTITFFYRYLLFNRGQDLYISILSCALLFCTKENSFLHTFVFITFFILMGIYPIVLRRENSSFGNLVNSSKDWALERKYKIIIAFCLFWIVFILFYTTFFTNLRGFIDGLGRKAIPYWINQNKIRRVRGEYHYHLTRMLMYELPLVIGFIWSAVQVFWKRRKHFLYAVVVTIIILGLCFAMGNNPLPVYDVIGEHGNVNGPGLTPEQQQQLENTGLIGWLLNSLHMQCYYHVFIFAYVTVMGFWLTFLLLESKEYFPAFLFYTSMFNFLMYSYLGEKVPWLTIHIYLPMAITVAYHARSIRESYRLVYVFIVGILVLYMAYCSYGLNFYKNGINEDNPSEIICYTQTHADMKNLVKEVKEIASVTGLKNNLPIFVRGEATWPLSWYWRENKRVYWAGVNMVPDTSRPVVVLNWKDRNKYDYILADYFEMKQYKLRAWDIMPNLCESDIDKFVRRCDIKWGDYFQYLVARLDRKPLCPESLGSTDIAVFFRKDVLEGKYKPQYKTGSSTRKHKPRIEKSKPIFVPNMLEWGEPGTGEGQFRAPRAITVNNMGEVYVADTMNNRIQKFDENGRFLLAWGKTGNNPGEFNQPSGIAVDKDGYMYVSDTWNHRIQKFTPDGKFVNLWGIPGPGNSSMEFWAPKGLALDIENNLFVVNTGLHRINKFTTDGKSIVTWGFKTIENSATPSGFFEPVGITIDSSNMVYVCDTNNHRVQVFNNYGKFIRDFSTLGWQNLYTEPYICVNAMKDVFVSDSVNHRIQIYSNDGDLIAVWGRQGTGSGEFQLPKGLVYSDGYIYVVDSQNSRIQKFDETSLGLY